MWAYCLNNPLIYEDSQGKIGILGTLLIGTAIGAAFGFIGNCITNLIASDNILDGWALATISGAATGLLATSGLGVAGQAIGNAIISAGGKYIPTKSIWQFIRLAGVWYGNSLGIY